MPNSPILVIYFYKNDGQRERTTLPNATIAEAAAAIERVFYIGDGLYTKAEIYRGNELIETVVNSSSIRVESVLVQ